MAAVLIRPVDERDSSFENYNPCFRVYLQGGATSTSGAESTGGYTDTVDITGADILQVIDWAQRAAASLGEDFTYAIALVVEGAWGEGRGLVWLVGRDGNDQYGPDDQDGIEAQKRMLARRGALVHVPRSDGMPTEARLDDRDSSP